MRACPVSCAYSVKETCSQPAVTGSGDSCTCAYAAQDECKLTHEMLVAHFQASHGSDMALPGSEQPNRNRKHACRAGQV